MKVCGYGMPVLVALGFGFDAVASWPTSGSHYVAHFLCWQGHSLLVPEFQ